MFEAGLEFLRADFHLHTRKDKEFSYKGEPNDFVKSYQTVDKVPVFAGTFTMSTAFLV